MNRHSSPPDDSWESDAVWQLLDQAPPKTAGTRFADDVVRAARLSAEEKSRWTGWFAPAPLAGFLAATAALVIGVVALVGPDHGTGTQASVMDSAQAVALQDIAETETLIAAADQLEDFSDNELVSLIGF